MNAYISNIMELMYLYICLRRQLICLIPISTFGTGLAVHALSCKQWWISRLMGLKLVKILGPMPH